MCSCDGWQLHVNEGYTELPTQSVGDFLGGTFVDKPKGGHPTNSYFHNYLQINF